MIEIDGGDGGGQLLRTAMALAGLTGRSVEITDIRGARSPPGLRPQHLAAVTLLGKICDAELSEVSPGTQILTFEPAEVTPGSYDVEVETAGSLPLIFDAVLPLALQTPGPVEVRASGGTDVKWAPTAAHYCHVKLPLLWKHGLFAFVDVDRPGFYPAGGGRATLRLAPSELTRIALTEFGSVTAARVYSTASADLADRDVADRQADRAVERLQGADRSVEHREVRYATADSPGSAVLVRLDGERSIAGFDALGEKGVTAESVADRAVDAAIDFGDEPDASVDRHIADQLMPFLGVAGGRIRIPAVTDHVRTHLDVFQRFDLDIEIEEDPHTTLAAPGHEP